ncbi:MAG: NUDIX domain-containing protein [Candidatus Heimdallarchaeaceae archaeon]|jgi:ADP-ribose pyrophosphatase YjhB (NUDIX family)
MQSDYVAKHSLHKIGVGGLCIHNNKILFVKHKYGINTENWTLPGGYVELGESLSSAVEREVLEETGVQTQAVELLAIRHMTNEKIDRGLISDLYIVFKLEYKAGEPSADKVEIVDSQFLPMDKIGDYPISELSNHIVKHKSNETGFALLPYQPSEETKEKLLIHNYQLYG